MRLLKIAARLGSPVKVSRTILLKFILSLKKRPGGWLVIHRENQCGGSVTLRGCLSVAILAWCRAVAACMKRERAAYLAMSHYGGPSGPYWELRLPERRCEASLSADDAIDNSGVVVMARSEDHLEIMVTAVIARFEEILKIAAWLGSLVKGCPTFMHTAMSHYGGPWDPYWQLRLPERRCETSLGAEEAIENKK